MSHGLITWALKIKIVPVIVDADHSEIGVYQNDDDTQEIRWCEAPLTGTTQAWKSGIIQQMGDIEKRLDISNGGNIEDYSGLTAVVSNNGQLSLKLKELGLTLNGLPAEIWEFVGTNSDADSITPVLRYTGVVCNERSTEWDENYFSIEIKNGRYRRNAFLGTYINNDSVNGNFPNATDDVNGKIVPLTMGKFQIIDGVPNPAKFIRTAGKQTVFTNSMNKAGASQYCYPEDQSVFPVVGNYCGVTESGTKVITIGCTDYISVGDHIKIWSGFPDGSDKEVTAKDSTTITVDGSNATSTAFTLIDFLHADGEDYSPAIAYVLKIGLDYSGTLTRPPNVNSFYSFMDDIQNKWMKIEIGGATDSTLTGRYKKIKAYQMADWYYADGVCLVTVFLESYFEKNLSGNSTATATGQAWASISDLPFQFNNDIWPVAGFLDSTGTPVDVSEDKSLWLYGYNSDSTYLEKKSYEVSDDQKLIITSSLAPIGFKRFAPYGYVATPGGDLNFLLINAMLFDSDPSQLLSFDIIPVAALSEFEEADLSKYGLSLVNLYGAGSYDNAYAEHSAASLDITCAHTKTLVPGGDTSAAFDRDDTSYEQHSYVVFANTPPAGSGFDRMIVAFEATIDFSKLANEYDSYYLGVDIETSITGEDVSAYFENSPLFFKLRKFMGISEFILSEATGQKYYDIGVGGGKIKNLPTFYYLVGTADNDKHFYFTPTETAQMKVIQGCVNFPFSSVDTSGKIKAIYKMGLLFEALFSVTPAISYTFTHTIKIKEASLICKLSGSIKNELFALCQGRIFDDTWGSRRLSAAMIEDPPDFIEHFKRLGDGSEFGDGVEAGKVYSPSMPIKTGVGVEGSYDSADIDYAREYSPAWQVFSANEAWIDRQVVALCRTFGLCTYVGSDGYECITTINKINPTETILFTDIMPGSMGKTKEPEIDNIFCQPVFNYRFNSGSGKYDKQMVVLSVQAEVYNSAYTPGIDNTLYILDESETTPDGEYVWNACKALYAKYRQVEQCPSIFSDQPLLVDYEDAIKVFYSKITKQDFSRNSFDVSYNKGKDYFAGKHVKIKLPFQTYNLSVEVFLERVVLQKNKNRVHLEFALLEDVPTAFFFE